jgi:hypothetical protein
MKMNVLFDKSGKLVAATSGPIGEPKDMASHLKGANGQPVAFIIQGPGQTVREVDVPENLTDVTKVDEFQKFIMESAGR